MGNQSVKIILSLLYPIGYAERREAHRPCVSAIDAPRTSAILLHLKACSVDFTFKESASFDVKKPKFSVGTKIVLM